MKIGCKHICKSKFDIDLNADSNAKIMALNTHADETDAFDKSNLKV